MEYENICRDCAYLIELETGKELTMKDQQLFKNKQSYSKVKSQNGIKIKTIKQNNPVIRNNLNQDVQTNGKKIEPQKTRV